MPFVQAKPLLKKLKLKGVGAVKQVVNEVVKTTNREVKNKKKVKDYYDNGVAFEKNIFRRALRPLVKQKIILESNCFLPIKLEKFQDISDESSDELSRLELNPLAQSTATEQTVEEAEEKRKTALSRKVRKNPETFFIN